MGVADWGVRLSDRIRAAIGARDLAGARRLAERGDGEARSLAKEYALMVRGLGFTIRILLGLLGATLARQPERVRPRAAAALSELLGRFGGELRAVTGLSAAVPGRGGEATEALAQTARLVAEAEEAFFREQARLAAETIRALEAGDAGRAGGLLDEKEGQGYLRFHDRLIRFMADAFAHVLVEFGPEELQRFHRATAERQREGFEKWERLAPAEFARTTAFLLKQHMGRVEVREDGERFTIVQAPCGSGGRLRLAGAYAGPGALPFVEARGPLTLGEERLPVYCTHCPIWNGVAPAEWFGHPQWVFEEPSRPDGSCTLHIYKRPAAVPPAYLRRLGMAGRA